MCVYIYIYILYYIYLKNPDILYFVHRNNNNFSPPWSHKADKNTPLIFIGWSVVPLLPPVLCQGAWSQHRCWPWPVWCNVRLSWDLAGISQSSTPVNDPGIIRSTSVLPELFVLFVWHVTCFDMLWLSASVTIDWSCKSYIEEQWKCPQVVPDLWATWMIRKNGGKK